MTTSALIGLDANVVVHWCLQGSALHTVIRKWVRSAVTSGYRFALTQQVLGEFLHVVTDRRRFERPLAMPEALEFSEELWHSPDVERVTAEAGVHDRVRELMKRHRLGRKRILDTQFAATLESAGVERLATLNGRDFEIFTFLQVIDPRGQN